jgi:FlaA1/EpsC-like NDP-sugar epimerase
MAIWDIIYEHCSYFSPVSLSYIFTQCGFKVKEIAEEFQGQFLTLEATKSNQKLEQITLNQKEIDAVKAFSQDIALFRETFNQKLLSWQKILKRISDQGQRAVAWGAGSKGVTFLNLIKQPASINYIVDINPRKYGKYIAGTGQQIVSPEFLSDYQPDVVIIMNSIYQDEIKQQVRELGVTPEFMCV